jgi:putative colanic acid biosynthesis UDP-glucose lipid carrier transferase
MKTKGRLRPYEPLLMSLHRFFDAFLGAALLLVLAWYFSHYGRDYLILAAFTFLIALVCMEAVGLYRSWRTNSLYATEIRRLLSGCISVSLILLSAIYFLNISHHFSRLVMILWMTLWPLVLVIERLAIRYFLRYQRHSGKNYRTSIICGAGDLGQQLAQWIIDNPWSGTKIIGFFDDKAMNPLLGYPILDNLKAAPEFVLENKIDAVYLTLPMRAEAKINKLVAALADSTASIYLVPDIFFCDLILGGIFTFFNGLPIVALRDTPLHGLNSLLKRMEDVILSSIILLAAAPIMLVIAIIVKFTSKGPILFRQWRYGLNGNPIEIYKFRTMRVCEDGYEFKQAVKNDPRVTPIGSFLRKTSLDELPQLINVFQGRMSLVGPRPHPVAMNEAYRKLVPGYMLRHKIRPGLTGLAQISGWRGETDTLEKMKKRIEYDLKYLRNWSFFLDLKIIFKTAIALVRANNAY